MTKYKLMAETNGGGELVAEFDTLEAAAAFIDTRPLDWMGEADLVAVDSDGARQVYVGDGVWEDLSCS